MLKSTRKRECASLEYKRDHSLFSPRPLLTIAPKSGMI